MQTIFLMYRAQKDSTLDQAIKTIGKQHNYSIEVITYPIGPHHKLIPGSTILVRNSDIPTQSIEKSCFVYPSEKVRHSSKDKWNLYNYCIENDILAPKTIRAEELLSRYIFKLAVGSNKSVVNPFAIGSILAQTKMAGKVVKTYGHVCLANFIGFDEKTRQKVEVPSHISKVGRKILRDFHLIWAGLDWIVSESWYLIDLNATSGFGFSPMEDSLPIIEKGLEILLKKNACRARNVARVAK